LFTQTLGKKGKNGAEKQMAPAAARVRDNRPDAGPPGPIPKDDLSIAAVRGIALANYPFLKVEVS
jgi:hypothetical protein